MWTCNETKTSSSSKALKRKNCFSSDFMKCCLLPIALIDTNIYPIRMCEIVGKRFIKFWAHSNFMYQFTDLYKVQQVHCQNIGLLTDRVSTIENISTQWGDKYREIVWKKIWKIVWSSKWK